MVEVAGLYRKTDLLGIQCVVIYSKISGCSNVRRLPVLYYPMQTHSQGAKEGAMDPLYIRMHPLGLYEISEKILPPSRKKRCDTLPHPLVDSDETPWLERTHFQKCVYMQCAWYSVIIPWHNTP
jgi:hypothetical protein